MGSAQDDMGSAQGDTRDAQGGMRFAQGDVEVIQVEVNDRLFRVRLIDLPGRPATNGVAQRRAPRLGGSARSRGAVGNAVLSPMHGVIVEIGVAEGQPVHEGQVVAVIEAMKMMNEIRAQKAGSVTKIHTSAGATVESGSPLMAIA